MRLIHDGRPSEALLEDGREYRRGDVIDTDDERGHYLLDAQPVALKTADEPAPDTTTLEIAVADNETPREATTGEAQSIQGDDAA